MRVAGVTFKNGKLSYAFLPYEFKLNWYPGQLTGGAGLSLNGNQVIAFVEGCRFEFNSNLVTLPGQPAPVLVGWGGALYVGPVMQSCSVFETAFHGNKADVGGAVAISGYGGTGGAPLTLDVIYGIPQLETLLLRWRFLLRRRRSALLTACSRTTPRRSTAAVSLTSASALTCRQWATPGPAFLNSKFALLKCRLECSFWRARSLTTMLPGRVSPSRPASLA